MFILNVASARIVFSGLLASLVSYGGEEQRVLELSTRAIPLNGQIEFYGDDGPVGDPIPVSGERFIWRVVPPEAKKFEVTSLSTKSGEFPLFESGHTFAVINPTRPLDSSSPSDGGVPKRLALVEVPVRNIEPAPVEEKGWVFIGSLDAASDDSEWSSLYVLNPGSRARPDKDEQFTYGKLKQRVNDGEPGKRTFVVDFPLVIRESATAPKVAGAVQVRPGQSFVVDEVKRAGTSVYARITVE